MILTLLQPLHLAVVRRKNIILALVLKGFSFLKGCICFELLASQPTAFIDWLNFLIPHEENLWFSKKDSYIGLTLCTYDGQGISEVLHPHPTRVTKLKASWWTV